MIVPNAYAAVNKDGVICMASNCWNIWHFSNLSNINTLLEPMGTYPSNVWTTQANCPTWDALLYKFRYLFLEYPASSPIVASCILPILYSSMSSTKSPPATKLATSTNLSPATTKIVSFSSKISLFSPQPPRSRTHLPPKQLPPWPPTKDIICYNWAATASRSWGSFPIEFWFPQKNILNKSMSLIERQLQNYQSHMIMQKCTLMVNSLEKSAFLVGFTVFASSYPVKWK